MKTELSNVGSLSSSTCAGYIKLEFLVIKPVRLQKDDPDNIFWPKLDIR